MVVFGFFSFSNSLSFKKIKEKKIIHSFEHRRKLQLTEKRCKFPSFSLPQPSCPSFPSPLPPAMDTLTWTACENHTGCDNKHILQHCLHKADVTGSGFLETGSQPLCSLGGSIAPSLLLLLPQAGLIAVFMMSPSFLQGIQKPLEESFQAQETENDWILLCWVNYSRPGPCIAVMLQVLFSGKGADSSYSSTLFTCRIRRKHKFLRAEEWDLPERKNIKAYQTPEWNNINYLPKYFYVIAFFL